MQLRPHMSSYGLQYAVGERLLTHVDGHPCYAPLTMPRLQVDYPSRHSSVVVRTLQHLLRNMAQAVACHGVNIAHVLLSHPLALRQLCMVCYTLLSGGLLLLPVVQVLLRFHANTPLRSSLLLLQVGSLLLLGNLPLARMSRFL